MNDKLRSLTNSPNLKIIVSALAEVWPEHLKYLQQHFENLDKSVLETTEEMAGLIVQLVGGKLFEYCEDYKWMCAIFMREDVHFRKTGKYRLNSFSEAYDQVYSNAQYMSRYINGILFSQILWTNQAVSFAFYVHIFLPQIVKNDDFLEIGPGHGLLLYFAAKLDQVKSITGWDVSQSSIEATEKALNTLGVTRSISLVRQNILEIPTRKNAFDVVVFSEVLEHLDNPAVALKNTFQVMRPGAGIFLNVPVNSPAPDHIYLWHSPEEVMDLVTSCGFEIERTHFAPATGFSEEQARRRKVTINTLIIAKKPK